MTWLLDAALWLDLYFAGEWVIRLAMLGIVPLRRSPSAALAWLMVIFLVPIPGLFLFLLFGRSRMPRWRHERLDEFSRRMGRVRDRLVTGPCANSAEADADIAATAALAHNLGRFRVAGGNRVELLSDYEGAIARLIADIDSACDHVHLLYYILADDGTTARVFEALDRAVRRGVACRVLFDAVGSRTWARQVLKKLRASGVDAHAVLPWGLFHRRAARVDMRNHRKIAVIDGRVGYVGSQNLVDSQFIEGLCYEELVARVTGQGVWQLQYVFASDWYLDGAGLLDEPRYFPEVVPAGDVCLQVLPSGPHSPHDNNLRLIVNMVHAARERVVVTTPYFVPDEALLQALETAAVRGVDVRLIVSRKTDNWLVRLAQESYYDQLLDFGVRLYRYEPQFLHAKWMSVDGKIVLIGSANMDIRSFRLNSEISVLIYDTQVAAALDEQEQRYLTRCHELDRDRWGRLPYARRLTQGLARLVSPLL